MATRTFSLEKLWISAAFFFQLLDLNLILLVVHPYFSWQHILSRSHLLKIHRGEHNEPGPGLAQHSHPQSCMVSKYAASSPVIPFLIPMVSKGVFHIPSGYLT